MRHNTVLLILLAVLLIGLFIYGSLDQAPEDEVIFYYPQKELQFGISESVIMPELRDMGEHVDEPEYLIRMYLLGPLDDKLAPVFPKGTRFLSREMVDDRLTITLSDDGGAMSEIRFTLAAACLARTYWERSGSGQLTVIRGRQRITLGGQNILTQDTLTPSEANGGTP